MSELAEKCTRSEATVFEVKAMQAEITRLKAELATLKTRFQCNICHRWIDEENHVCSGMHISNLIDQLAFTKDEYEKSQRELTYMGRVANGCMERLKRYEEPCGVCGGSGKVNIHCPTSKSLDANDGFTDPYFCRTCHGTGYTDIVRVPNEFAKLFDSDSGFLEWTRIEQDGRIKVTMLMFPLGSPNKHFTLTRLPSGDWRLEAK